MQFFDDHGRRLPENGSRVFGPKPSFYYQLNQPAVDYDLLLSRSKQFNAVPLDVHVSDLQKKSEGLLQTIKESETYSKLTNGVKVPFITSRKERDIDLGGELESRLLPALKDSFNAQFPEAHFKAVLQSNSELPGNISVAAGSRYEELILAADAGVVVGWYFPQALQEFDTHSQRSQMTKLPKLAGAHVCLSGGIDICAAVGGFPDLLISDAFYTPILCMSAYVHRDPRLVLLLKAYGPHMEFWCMTQMLTSRITQVSEQWAGGLTIYSAW